MVPLYEAVDAIDSARLEDLTRNNNWKYRYTR